MLIEEKTKVLITLEREELLVLTHILEDVLTEGVITTRKYDFAHALLSTIRSKKG